MRSLISLGLKKEEILKIPDNKGYINLTVSIEDKLGKFGHNASVTVEQTKEQRAAKATRVFVGNGKVIWTQNGQIKTAKQMEANSSSSEPF